MVARDELVKVPATVLGNRLRAKRKSLRMSQHQLGGKEFSSSYVSALERGKIRPSLKALYILADRLGESVTYFLQDEGAAQSPDLVTETLRMARIHIYQGQAGEAIAKLAPLPLEGQPLHVQAQVHLRLGEAYLANQQPAEALSQLQEALSLAESAGDALSAAYCRLYQGVAYLQQHKAGIALEFHRRCLKAITDGELKDLHFTLQVYRYLADDLLAIGQGTDALPYGDAAVSSARKGFDLRTLAATLWEVSSEYKAAGDTSQASTYAEKSLAAYETLDILAAAAATLSTYATVLAETNDIARAESIFQQALELGERIGDIDVLATSFIKMGAIAGQKQQYAEAQRLIQKGVDLARSHKRDLVAGQGLLDLAQVYVAQGARAQAEETFLAAISLLEAMRPNHVLSAAYFRYGQALKAWGDSARGSEYLEKAYLQGRKS